MSNHPSVEEDLFATMKGAENDLELSSSGARVQGWSLSFQRRNRELSVETAGELCAQGTCWCRGTVPVSLPCETFARGSPPVIYSIPSVILDILHGSCTERAPTYSYDDAPGGRERARAAGRWSGWWGERNGREREAGGGAGSTEREREGRGGMRSDLAGWGG
ncbi:hypothetical protein OIDMADRAFT_24405 [Oidiodendron maius Zn]|uniref:Uncharacterized protein n=1 Tax=Oidiodendron maius (strain Zn) TaxID=913774 RepID=A0A0C3DVC5_OIDMZ|nr:hypothetical protein OIDMADRAFT_24405 [Oidiodendron maius Zn]